MPADDIVRQFLDLLSAPAERCGGALIRNDVATADPAAQLRLTLADASVDATRRTVQRLMGAAGELTFVVAAACVVALATGLRVWTAVAAVALIWLPATAVLCGHEVFYRMLRLDRWSIFAAHPRPTQISRAAATLVSAGNTSASESSGAAADAVFGQPGVQEEPSSAASIH